MADSSQALKAGTRLQSGKYTYTVEHTLGQGGFGITYLVTTTVYLGQIEAEVKCAVKELFIDDMCERVAGTSQVSVFSKVADRVASARKDFVAEARRLQMVSDKSHNIVKVNEVFEANDTAYYVMEYLQGQSLADYLKAKGRLTADEVRLLLGPIADALRVLHANRMTHLDVKPANIMLARQKDGSIRPVLIDFGLAKHYDEEGNATSTLHTVGFSEGYAPVEQYMGLTSFSPASDVYALGATIFRTLTGVRPAKASEVDLDDIRSVLASVNAPADLTRLVVAAMSARRADRLLLTDSAWGALKGPTTISAGTISTDDDDRTAFVSEDDVPVTVVPAECGHVNPSNFELCATKDGRVRYFTQAEWKALADRNSWTRKGVYVSGDGLEFLVSLFEDDNGGEGYTWQQAVDKYGDRLPSKEQGEVMAINYEKLNAAIIAFGGDEDPGWWYWTRTEENSSTAWNVYLNDGYVYKYFKTYNNRVRAVAPVPTGK